MSLKSILLKELEANRGKYLSGEVLASTLSVSRTAVWKAIKDLRGDGYVINAFSNKGYALDMATDMLSKEGISAHLPQKYTKMEIICLKTTDSTQNAAKEYAAKGALPGTLIISDEQTAGRGRFQRGFHSPPGTGIYMSLIAKPPPVPSDALLITIAAGVAVCRAVKSLTDYKPQIKWVNDILLKGKKICGILTEAVTDIESGGISSIIVGIGINFNTSFSGELEEKASSLFPDKALTRNQLTAAILTQLLPFSENLGAREFIDEYRELSCVLGKDITVFSHTGEYSAKALSIDDNGGLVVITDDGTTKTLTSGEVSIRI